MNSDEEALPRPLFLYSQETDISGFFGNSSLYQTVLIGMALQI